MTKPVLKIVAVVAITIGLLIPLGLTRRLIHERTSYRSEARADIAHSWTGAQNIVGPLLAVPIRPSGTDSGAKSDCLVLTPEMMLIQASLRTERRKRGLYSIPVYYTKIEIAGEFDLSRAALVGEVQWTDLDLDAAFLDLSFSDNRGIVREPTLDWGGAVLEVASGTLIPLPAQGVHAAVGPLELDKQAAYPFRLEMELRGMETLQFAPIGRDTRVVMDAGWPHPSFIGSFLPVEYEIDGDGFTAEWRVSGLASGRNPMWLKSGSGAATVSENMLGVSLINPVDIYQQAMRSIKYGILIVLLTFTAFFLIEMFRQLMLHPMQYLLVGLALVIFFLLLLALSEHMAFGLAYLIASIACVGLVAVYTTSILGSTMNGVCVTTTLGGLYAMLYVILRSEDYALLMGSLLLFIALAAVMMVTRRINWYRLGKQLQPADAAVELEAGE